MVFTNVQTSSRRDRDVDRKASVPTPSLKTHLEPSFPARPDDGARTRTLPVAELHDPPRQVTRYRVRRGRCPVPALTRMNVLSLR